MKRRRLIEVDTADRASPAPGRAGAADARATSDPHPVQKLQSAAGNRATARLLRDREASSAGGETSSTVGGLAAADPVLQRRIGFEIETDIPVKKRRTRKGKHEFVDPNYQDIDAKLLNNSTLDVDSNPAGGGKILEFASAPVDDTQPVDQFAATALTWLNKLAELRASALTSPPYKRLRKRVPTAPKNIRYGVGIGAPGNMERASIQMTHGLQLAQVREFFQNLALRNPTGASRVTKKEAAAHQSVPAVDPVMRNLAQEVDPAGVPNTTPAHVEEVAGYLTMIAQSMMAGRMVETGYIKNRSFLFYKSKLSDVRNQLVANNPYAAAVFNSQRQRALVKLSLMVVTGRKVDERLFVGTNRPDVGPWLDDILTGTDDPAFEAARNPWGTDIAPEPVGGELAAVVEHRDIDKVVPPAGQLKMSDVNGLLDYLKAVYVANQNWQDLGPDADSESESSSEDDSTHSGSETD